MQRAVSTTARKAVPCGSSYCCELHMLTFQLKPPRQITISTNCWFYELLLAVLENSTMVITSGYGKGHCGLLMVTGDESPHRITREMKV